MIRPENYNFMILLAALSVAIFAASWHYLGLGWTLGLYGASTAVTVIHLAYERRPPSVFTLAFVCFVAAFLLLGMHCTRAQHRTDLSFGYGLVEDGLDDTSSLSTGLRYTYRETVGASANVRKEISGEFMYDLQGFWVFVDCGTYRARLGAGAAYTDRPEPLAGLTNLFKVHKRASLVLALEATPDKVYASIGFELKI